MLKKVNPKKFQHGCSDSLLVIQAEPCVSARVNRHMCTLFEPIGTGRLSCPVWLGVSDFLITSPASRGALIKVHP